MSDETAQPIRRWQVLRRLVTLYPDPRYLEIGVNKGHTFEKVPAARKVAVDPKFLFDHETKGREHPEATYLQVTSDEYFNRFTGPDDVFDVIYLDGLHVYDQTLRDLLNALQHLQPRGVVVIDDTRPSTEIAALRDPAEYRAARRESGASRQWMGDVFKVVFFIQAYCPFLRYGTIANNHGQTVLWRGRRDEQPRHELAEIAAMGFEELKRSEDVLRLRRFGGIRNELRRDLVL